MSDQPRMPIESGTPDHFQYMHPTLRKNYGQWAYHDRPRPGVLHHVSKYGDEVWTVKTGSARQLDILTLRTICDIADEFCDGYLRFTMRGNMEFMVTDESKVEPLIKRVEEAGFPVGGTGNSVTMLSHTQGWLHCDIPGTDASGVVKALMDELYDEFKVEEMPNRVHITTSCCQINCGGQGDIAINVQHTKPPKINAAIRPAMVNGKPTLEVDEKKCICCGACFPPCPPMQINDSEYTRLSIWVGGKHSNARTKPMFHKLVASNIPNNAPRWPEVAAIVKKILKAYKENANEWERMGEWVERIGWKRFFELTDLPFTKYHIDNWRGSRNNLNQSAHIRF